MMIDDFVASSRILVAYKDGISLDSVYLDNVVVNEYENKKFLVGKRVSNPNQFCGGCEQMIWLDSVSSIIKIDDAPLEFKKHSLYRRFLYLITGRF